LSEILKQELVIVDCGLQPYKKILEYQTQLCKKRQLDQIPNTALLLEHKPVITLGARQSENKLLADETTLRNKNIETVNVRRGGGTTAHNPGQLVIYPIIKLKQIGIGVNEYVRTLEQLAAKLLKKYELDGKALKGKPGLWVDTRKIASIGVQIKKWVTFHGIAINACNDLSIFDLMVPCGLDNVVMTSIEKETGRKIDINELKSEAKNALTEFYSDKNMVTYQKW
jgi:lipoyl(octanoyl) transferase